MSTRLLWIVLIAACYAAILAGLDYAYRLPSGQHTMLPLLVGAPATLLSRHAWRRIWRIA